MPPKKVRDPGDLVQVTVRLYADDLEALKGLAATDRQPWNSVLRRVLHEALFVSWDDNAKQREGVLR